MGIRVQTDLRGPELGEAREVSRCKIKEVHPLRVERESALRSQPLGARTSLQSVPKSVGTSLDSS